MPDKNTDRLDAMMRKVEGLLAKADDAAATPEEADSARAMAERIMTKYKIEEEDLIKRGDLKVDGLNVMFKDVGVYPINSEYDEVYMYLVSAALDHCGVMGVWSGTVDGVRMLQFIGYEADIRYAEALFMSARLYFADRMEPKPNPNLSDAENVYRMRSAGMERRRVADLMGWVKGGAKVTRLYKQECERRGEDPVLTGQGVSVVDYRMAYAQAFKTEFWMRLCNARNAIDAEVDGGLVLHGRKERVKEAMYQRYPYLRPDESRTPAKRSTPAKYRWTKADEKRWQRQNTAAGRAGQAAGKKAASEVDVHGATPKRRLS